MEMCRRFSVVTTILIALLTLASPAPAQAPAVGDVPAEIREPARTQLTRQRADLLAQREAIATKVRTHNERCADVPVGGAAEASCAAAQKQLNVVITDYRAAVEAFNKAVAAAPR